MGAVSEQNIGDAIGRIRTAKSFGHDNISSYFLKQALPLISGSLARLFNIAIETSTFPDAWKIARVTPIFREGEKCEKSNYRPISVLPVVARLFEKLVFNQLYQYLDENGCRSPKDSSTIVHFFLASSETSDDEQMFFADIVVLLARHSTG